MGAPEWAQEGSGAACPAPPGTAPVPPRLPGPCPPCPGSSVRRCPARPPRPRPGPAGRPKAAAQRLQPAGRAGLGMPWPVSAGRARAGDPRQLGDTAALPGAAPRCLRASQRLGARPGPAVGRGERSGAAARPGQRRGAPHGRVGPGAGLGAAAACGAPAWCARCSRAVPSFTSWHSGCVQRGSEICCLPPASIQLAGIVPVHLGSTQVILVTRGPASFSHRMELGGLGLCVT